MIQFMSGVAFRAFIIVSRKAVKDAIYCQLVANSLAFSRRENDTKIASKALKWSSPQTGRGSPND